MHGKSVALAACVIPLCSCGNDSSSSIQPTSSIESVPIEYKLASLNAGAHVPKNDITVARFRSLLEQLSRKFVEDKNEIADITVRSQSILKESGVAESLLNIMEAINKTVNRKIANQKYAEYVTAYVVLRIQGQSHQEALEGIAAILSGLGVR